MNDAHDFERESCLDNECQRPWDDHSPRQKARCIATAMLETYTDPATRVEYEADLAAGDPTAPARLAEVEREIDRLARALWPGAYALAREREAER